MRELAAAQAASGVYAGVAMAVVVDARWPAEYRRQLRASGLTVFEHPTPALFGTASFLWQALRPPPLQRWLQTLQTQTRAARLVVHAHNAWMSGVFLPLPRVPNADTVFVTTVHGVNAQLDGRPLRHAAHRWMAQRLLRFDARLTSVDQSNLARAHALFGLPPERFTVIPNGVPPAPTPGVPSLRGASVFTVGHVGSLTERKGWRIVAEAAARIAASGRPIRLLLAGAGEDEPAVRAFANAHPTFTEFLGFVPDPRLTLMPRLDLLAVMSVMEGLPMNIIEAMSAGVPVAATAVGGIPEAVTNNITGALIPRTVDALERVILDLMDHPERLAAWSAATTAAFNRTFAIAHILNHYDRVYRT